MCECTSGLVIKANRVSFSCSLETTTVNPMRNAYIIVSDGEVEAGVGASQPNGFLVIGSGCPLLAVKVPDMHWLAACTHTPNPSCNTSGMGMTGFS